MCDINLGDVLYSPTIYAGAVTFFRVVYVSKTRKTFKVRELRKRLSEVTGKYFPVNDYFDPREPRGKSITVKPHETVDCLLFKNNIGIYPYTPMIARD